MLLHTIQVYPYYPRSQVLRCHNLKALSTRGQQINVFCFTIVWYALPFFCWLIVKTYLLIFRNGSWYYFGKLFFWTLGYCDLGKPHKSISLDFEDTKLHNGVSVVCSPACIFSLGDFKHLEIGPGVWCWLTTSWLIIWLVPVLNWNMQLIQRICNSLTG